MPDVEKGARRCQIVGWSRDPYEPHIPAQAEWEQADDCPIHPLSSTPARPCSCGIAKGGETTTHPSGEVVVHVAYPSACYVAEASSSTPATPADEDDFPSEVARALHADERADR